MGKLLLPLSMLCLLITAIGTTLFSRNPVFWFANYTPAYQWARGLACIVMFLQLITRSPRHATVRVITGVLAISVGVWAIYETYISHMLVLDTLSLLAAALAIGSRSLEIEPTVLPEPSLFVAYIEQSPIWLQAATLK